jgi:hypothetical protein
LPGFEGNPYVKNGCIGITPLLTYWKFCLWYIFSETTKQFSKI